MLSIGKDIGLQRQKRAAGVDEVNAGKVVLLRDLLRAEMFLHRDRKVRAALHRRVIADDEALALMHASDAGDDARGGRFVVIHAVRGKWGQLEKRRIRIEQRGDALAHRHLSLFTMSCDVLLAPTLPHVLDAPLQLLNQALHPLAIGAERVARRIEMRFQRIHSVAGSRLPVAGRQEQR